MKRVILAFAAMFVLAYSTANAADETLFEPSRATFTVPGIREFIAEKKFVIDTSVNARVRISNLGRDFKKFMLLKRERDIAEAELRFSKLKRSSFDMPILTELGDRAEIPLHAFYEVLAHKQSIRDYTWVVGYVRDMNDNLLAVNAFWYGDSWSVRAFSVEFPDRWNAGHEFVSR